MKYLAELLIQLTLFTLIDTRPIVISKSEDIDVVKAEASSKQNISAEVWDLAPKYM